jgi:alkylation response protein AidB-like acyl-CoA dehydrogenase
LNFAFSEEQDEFREMLRRFLDERAPISEVRRAFSSPDGFDRALWKQMATELGLQGIHLPESVGGQGFGSLELGIVLEEMGRSLLPSPFFASSVLPAEAIRCVAGIEEPQALLSGIASGEEIATLAWVEAGSGWDPARVRLVVERDDSDYRLSGVKQAVLSADVATRMLVVARLPDTTGAEVFRCSGSTRRQPACASTRPSRSISRVVSAPSNSTARRPGCWARPAAPRRVSTRRSAALQSRSRPR